MRTTYTIRALRSNLDAPYDVLEYTFDGAHAVYAKLHRLRDARYINKRVIRKDYMPGGVVIRDVTDHFLLGD